MKDEKESNGFKQRSDWKTTALRENAYAPRTSAPPVLKIAFKSLLNTKRVHRWMSFSELQRVSEHKKPWNRKSTFLLSSFVWSNPVGSIKHLSEVRPDSPKKTAKLKLSLQTPLRALRLRRRSRYLLKVDHTISRRQSQSL